MGRHRLEPTRRVRPRFGRIAAAGLSLLVTLVALLGAVGVIPLGSSSHAADRGTLVADRPAAAGTNGPDTTPIADTTPTTGSSPTEAARSSSSTTAAPPAASAALPNGSGSGRRVVFSKSAQRVWLVGSDGDTDATYLVSGSVTNNLGPGRYHVYSRSRWAVGIEDSGVMQYFVRFAHGAHAAIGFHSIPTKDGVPLQTEAQLGTPQSHGCIRQKLSDAQRMWDFAGVGTDVVVVA